MTDLQVRGKFEMECVLPTFLQEKYRGIAPSATLSKICMGEVLEGLFGCGVGNPPAVLEAMLMGEISKGFRTEEQGDVSWKKRTLNLQL